jgi:hypothetical protein
MTCPKYMQEKTNIPIHEKYFLKKMDAVSGEVEEIRILEYDKGFCIKNDIITDPERIKEILNGTN